MSDQQFGFERLDVYRVSYEALRLVLRYRAKLRGLPGEIGPQLQRAAVSTVSLIGEGYGRQSLADKRHRWSIARGEANEAGAMVELARLFDVFSDDDYATLRQSYLRVTWMLTAMLS